MQPAGSAAAPAVLLAAATTASPSAASSTATAPAALLKEESAVLFSVLRAARALESGSSPSWGCVGSTRLTCEGWMGLAPGPHRCFSAGITIEEDKTGITVRTKEVYILLASSRGAWIYVSQVSLV